MISGGEAARRESFSEKKKEDYLRLVYNVNLENKKLRTGQVITFSNEYLASIQTPHADPFVVSVIIVNYKVRKVLLDSRSVADILFHNAFMRMKLSVERLTPK